MKGEQVLREQRASIEEVKSHILKSDRKWIIQNFHIEEIDAKEFFIG